jgi:hypothetical protein
VLSVRFTAEEYARVVAMAKDAGMLAGPYARATILDRRPRSKPAANLIFQKLLYELHSMATNFKQLADATGDERHLKRARFVGGHLVELLFGRDDLTELMEQQLTAINDAGHQINRLAHAANAGKKPDPDIQRAALRALKVALDPLEKAAQSPPEGSG